MSEQLNVLVIDDDDDVRSLLVNIITQRGHQAVPAPSAEKGLEILPFWTFQVAFLDHRLPGMEGLVLGEYLRRNNPDMMIALITADEDPRLERETREHSITYINKPFDVRDIERLLEEYVAAAQARDETRRSKEDDDFAPPLAEFFDALGESYDMPGVPQRIEDRVVTTVKRCLNDLRSAARYTERGRVTALAGLITAQVLGLNLPRLPSGRTLFEEYDEVMLERGRRTEFGQINSEDG